MFYLYCHAIKSFVIKLMNYIQEYTLKSTMKLTILSFILAISFQVIASHASEVDTPHWEELECEVHIISISSMFLCSIFKVNTDMLLGRTQIPFLRSKTQLGRGKSRM